MERYRIKKAPLLKGAGTAGEPPVAFAVTEGFHSRHFPKVQAYVETCKPAESPRFGYAKPPPFGKGGFGLRLGFHPVTIPGGFRE